MRWLVTGSKGMFGTDLLDVLANRGVAVTGVGSDDCDVRRLDVVRKAIDGFDVVVNAAAWTAVDAAEADEAAAFAVNAVGAHNVALAARDAGARMVHISTDYVFDGTATAPYAIDHPQAPCSAYGRTKAAGEWAVLCANPDALVVRTAWLYGEHGPSFVKTVLRLASQRETLRVVDDQTGQPTWTRDLASIVVELVAGGAAGGYHHGTNSGAVTRCDWAREIFRLSGLDPERVHACPSTEYPLPATRPTYSVLAPSPAVPASRPWSDALREYLGG